MGKREQQTIDDCSIHLELRRDGKFTAKSAGCGGLKIGAHVFIRWEKQDSICRRVLKMPKREDRHNHHKQILVRLIQSISF
jgi:hypothetical protein